MTPPVAPPPERVTQFKPYVPAESREPEMTFRALLAGVLLSAFFGSANAYLAMKAG